MGKKRQTVDSTAAMFVLSDLGLEPSSDDNNYSVGKPLRTITAAESDHGDALDERLLKLPKFDGFEGLLGNGIAKQLFVTAYEGFVESPASTLFTPLAAAATIKSLLAATVNAADSRSESLTQFIPKPWLANARLVSRYVEKEDSIKLCEATEVQRAAMVEFGLQTLNPSFRKPGQACYEILSSGQGAPLIQPFVFVLPRIGVMYWEPKDMQSALTYYMGAGALLLPLSEIRRYMTRGDENATTGPIVKLNLVGRARRVSPEKAAWEAAKQIGQTTKRTPNSET